MNPNGQIPVDIAGDTPQSAYRPRYEPKPVRRVTLVIIADGKRKTHVKVAPKGKAFTEAGVDALLDMIAENLDTTCPDHDFRVVPLGRDRFNLVGQPRRPRNRKQDAAA